MTETLQRVAPVVELINQQEATIPVPEAMIAEIEEALGQVDTAEAEGTLVVPQELQEGTRDSKDPDGHDGKKELYR